MALRVALLDARARRLTLLCAGVVAAHVAPTADATAQVVGEVQGHVADGQTARPIANARVQVTGRSDVLRTAEDGSFVVRGLPPGSYAATVQALGYAAITQEFEVRNGRVTTLNAVLDPQATVMSDVYVRATRDTRANNATVFTRAMIEQSGQRDLGELIQTVPGVVITRAGGPGQPSQVSIRGSSASQVLVLIDGVAVNSAMTGSADLSRVSLESVDNVTILAGAQSARYGPRAMAGVIEITTRTPRREASALVRGGALGEYDASATIGRTSAVQRTKFGAFVSTDYRTVNGDFSYDLPALRGGGRATRINSDATSLQILSGLSLDGAFGSSSLRGSWEHTERGLAGTIIQPSGTGRQGSTRLSTGGSAQGLIRNVAWTLATDVTHEDATFADRAPPFGQAFNDTISATGITALATAGAAHGFALASGGVELRTLDISSTMLAPHAPHWQQLLGAWGHAQVARELVFGVRIDVEAVGRIDRNSLFNDAVLSPRGLIRVSHGAWSSSLSVGSGYAPPTLSDQFFHEGVQLRANPKLGPERTRRDFEGRITLRESRLSVLTVSGDAAAYSSNIDGMILWFPDFRFVWSPTNYDVRRSGWELNGKVAAPFMHLELSGVVNRTDVTYTGEILHGQVAYRPRNSANINLTFAPRGFRVDVTNRHVGSRRTVAGSPLNSLAPYSVSDGRVSNTFAARRWTLTPTASIENLFNRPAAMLVDYPFPPRTWSISLRVRHSSSQSS